MTTPSPMREPFETRVFSLMEQPYPMIDLWILQLGPTMVSSKIYELSMTVPVPITQFRPITDDMTWTCSAIVVEDPIRVLVPILQVLADKIWKSLLFVLCDAHIPGQDNRTVFGKVAISSAVLVVVATRMIVIRNERKGPPWQDILTGDVVKTIGDSFEAKGTSLIDS